MTLTNQKKKSKEINTSKVLTKLYIDLIWMSTTFPLISFHCSRILHRISQCVHLVVLLLNLFLYVIFPQSFSFMSLTLLKSTDQLFCKVSQNVWFSAVSSWWEWHHLLWQEYQRNDVSIMCSSQCITSRSSWYQNLYY